MNTEKLKQMLHLQDECDVIVYDSEDEWLESRKKGIGGSDAGAILGMNKYTSPLQVYKEKAEGVVRDLSDNVFVRKGKDLEPLIRNSYVTPYFNELGYSVLYPNCVVVPRAYPWLRATPDAIAVSGDKDCVIIEIKWVSEYAESNWFGEKYCGVPESYYAQVQHYMISTGAKKAVVCALFDRDWTVRYFAVPFDLKFALDMVNVTKDFWTHNVAYKIAPKSIPSKDGYTMPDKSIIKTVDDAMTENVLRYLDISETINSLDKQRSKIKDVIIQDYLEGKIPRKGYVNVSEYTVKKLDSASVKTKFPEVYKECVKESVVHSTIIKKDK